MPSSIGGLTVELFARRHPEQVAGLVFRDAVNSEAFERFVVSRLDSMTWRTRMEMQAACLTPLAARLGVLRWVDPFGQRLEGSVDAERTRALLYRVEPMTTLCGVVRGIATSAQELRSAPSLRRDVPLVVLIHDKAEGLLPPGLGFEADAIEPEWRGLQQRLAERSSRGTWRVVPGSDHLIGNSEPHAVASAVLELLMQIHGTPYGSPRQFPTRPTAAASVR